MSKKICIFCGEVCLCQNDTSSLKTISFELCRGCPNLKESEILIEDFLRTILNKRAVPEEFIGKITRLLLLLGDILEPGYVRQQIDNSCKINLEGDEHEDIDRLLDFLTRTP